MHEGKLDEIEFLVKREDLCDTNLYAGNKVRSLGHILAVLESKFDNVGGK